MKQWWGCKVTELEFYAMPARRPGILDAAGGLSFRERPIMKDPRKDFFNFIRERRRVLEHIKDDPFVNVITPEHLWGFVEYVGNFLLEYGAITPGDYNIATGMAEDYEERIGSVIG